uniref:Uncharacterized protein n=1 Tax=Heterorhabditis bacteriophora TaxID=37862 RepID=A0A1I7W9L7_HETBA
MGRHESSSSDAAQKEVLPYFSDRKLLMDQSRLLVL